MLFVDYTLLTEIGFTTTEAKVYMALLGLRKATVNTISEKTGIYRKNIYDALEKLAKKGFVTSAVVLGAKRVEATNPEHLLVFLKEKEEQAKKLLPALMKDFRSEPATDEAFIFKSFGGIKAILQDMLKVKKTVYLIGSKGYWKTLPQLQLFFPQFDKKRVQLHIELKQIFDCELRGNEITKFELGARKFFPKAYSTPIHIWIYGDRVVSVFYGDEPIAFMIKSKKIAYGYRRFFNFMWDNLAED